VDSIKVETRWGAFVRGQHEHPVRALAEDGREAGGNGNKVVGIPKWLTPMKRWRHKDLKNELRVSNV
jgi:hypothetical protein